MKTDKENVNLRICINNLTDELSRETSPDFIRQYLHQHYGTGNIEQLSASDYDRVFDDLDFMLNDLK